MTVERSKPSEHSPSAKSPENAHEVKPLPKDRVFKLYPKKEKIFEHNITKVEDLITTNCQTVREKKVPGPKVSAAALPVRGEPAAAADVLTDLGETLGNDSSIKCVPKSINVVQDSKEEKYTENKIDPNKTDVRTSLNLLSPCLPESKNGSNSEVLHNIKILKLNEKSSEDARVELSGMALKSQMKNEKKLNR